MFIQFYKIEEVTLFHFSRRPKIIQYIELLTRRKIISDVVVVNFTLTIID
jgi:hypothetical protein